ncbi:tetratricopeptide repeat protein [Phytomonospora endophytica]|uniref:Tetratricopeptide (TPR) repeat protein n=1 Tax=Phytomonospora endophytica TaxID=714109 RepID=A0A841FJ43_9ACTN|nr:tetratricopeptide repeat protein [Phytomonospora endophytica]MBB6035894.1 tetratricopeptide (TPR) repeat protein [Phytomonospora endophytica]GIG71110.1 hypothetical protein Pen01_74050 [Phytomonospora endophytica]
MPIESGRIARAHDLYTRAVFQGEAEGLTTADGLLDAVEADLSLERGRVLHAKFLGDREAGGDPRELVHFEHAATLYRALGDERGEGEARFWIGTYHQVVTGDVALAFPFFEHALELATKTGDTLTMSYAKRHIAFAAQEAGNLAEAREQLEESTRLRRELGFGAGVAANLLALAFIARDDARTGDARALLDEATAEANAAGADGVKAWIEASRAEF